MTINEVTKVSKDAGWINDHIQRMLSILETIGQNIG